MSEQTTAATTAEHPEVGDRPAVDEHPEVGEHADEHPGGRRVEAADDPAARAAELAAEIGGEVVADVRATEAAVRARREAGRLTLAAGDDDGELLARADDIRTAAQVPAPITPEQIAEVRELAAKLRTAARIRERTEAKAADELRERISASAGLTVHPAAIRAAADAVAEATRALEEAERALADVGETLVMAELSEGETHE